MSLKSHLSPKGYRMAKRIARKKGLSISQAIELATLVYLENHQ